MLILQNMLQNGLHAAAGKLELKSAQQGFLFQNTVSFDRTSSEDAHERAETVHTDRYLAVMRKFLAAKVYLQRRGGHLEHIL